MSARDMLAEVVPEGKENAISRRQLAIRLEKRDRVVRRLVNEARLQGLPILNDQDGKGYYISYSEEVIERWANQELARARNITGPMMAVRKGYKEAK